MTATDDANAEARGSDAPEEAGVGTVVFERRVEAAHPYLWRHLVRSPESERALLSDPQIPQSFAWAMLERDTQPRFARRGEATLLILRGINLHPEAEPEDMISLRLLITTERIVSLEIRRLPFVDTLIEEISAGGGPESVGAFILRLVEALREEAEPVLDALEDDVSRLEQRTLSRGGALGKADRAELTDARQDAIMLHRFIAPQAAALEALARNPPPWLENAPGVIEEAEAFRRIGADLDTVRGRAQLISEEVTIAMSERSNRIMLTLSTVSVVFLPLTFLTGLLGVNLAGIPYAEHPAAFWGFAALLVPVTILAAALALRLLR